MMHIFRDHGSVATVFRTLRLALFPFVIALSVTGCIQTPPVHSVAGVENTKLALVTGSRVSDGMHNFEYFAVDQVDYKDVRSRFAVSLASPDELAIPLTAGPHILWIEGRAKRGIGTAPARIATSFTLNAVAGRKYQVRGRVEQSVAAVWLVDQETGQIVASVEGVPLTQPPPGYPTSSIPIFIRR